MRDEINNAEDALLEAAVVKQWTKRIKDAKKFFEKDFDRMRENMEFAAGLQWEGQETIESAKYVNNFVNREVNQKTANLYAKDPKAVYKRRPRLDYQIWDGKVETMQQAHAIVQHAMLSGQPSPDAIQAQAVLADIQHGKAFEALLDKVGTSMEMLYQYQCDTQAPDFKYQMKQLVRTTVTCGVGFVRLNFSREYDHALTATGTDDSFSMRMKRAKMLMEQIDDDKITEDDPRVEQLENLFMSLRNSVKEGDQGNIEERLEFDFPSSDSVIVDPKCKSLKGFVGARWIAQEYIIPLEEANAYFETEIKPGGELVCYGENGIEKLKSDPEGGTKNDPQEKPLVCIWEVFDITTKTHFFIADGWKEYVQEPESTSPSINRFWPIFSLTFNDIVVKPGCKVHIYPPSDVELIRHPQKEWNRTREELRKHRKGNRPWYLTVKGWLTEPDKESFGNHESNELVETAGIPPSGKLDDAVKAFQAAPIDANLYNTTPLTEDMAMSIGSNSAQQQQPQRHVAATPAVIQEQARITGSNSNVDDLDDLLSEIALAGGEMLLKEFSLDTVKRIVGPGAAWPEQNREDFLNQLYLECVAASSGRPNKAVDVANAQQIIPLMLQAGANPWAVIKYACKVLGSDIDPLDFAPTAPPQPPAQQTRQRQQPVHPGQVGPAPGGMGQPAPVMQGPPQ